MSTSAEADSFASTDPLRGALAVLKCLLAGHAVGGGREHGQPFLGYRLPAALANPVGAGVAAFDRGGEVGELGAQTVGQERLLLDLRTDAGLVEDVGGAVVETVAQGLDGFFLADPHLFGVLV